MWDKSDVGASGDGGDSGSAGAGGDYGGGGDGIRRIYVRHEYGESGKDN